MQHVLLKKLLGRGAMLFVAAVLSLGLAACGDSNLLADDEARGADRSFNSLNALVIADCNTTPEDTRPVAIDGLAFNNATPENTQPEDSLEGQTCI